MADRLLQTVPEDTTPVFIQPEDASLHLDLHRRRPVQFLAGRQQLAYIRGVLSRTRPPLGSAAA